MRSSGIPTGIPDRWTVPLSPCCMIVVRRSGVIHAYLNLCPNMSLPLNQEPGVFLSRDGQTLVCSRHFAQFEIDGGLCIAGACVGSRLERIPVHIDADHDMRVG